MEREDINIKASKLGYVTMYARSYFLKLEGMDSNLEASFFTIQQYITYITKLAVTNYHSISCQGKR